ncbi:MAG: DNA polymerase III subunit alpha [Bacteroidetes bacterium 4572_117]|nr:MAG: DNA polymerase III subunit alpha [Bacteroidetes bacterium 4572_117]
MGNFTHLHVHTQYSILDGASSIPGLIEKVKADGMKSLAITDHGNMFGVKVFHDKATKAGIKPIIGCEVYVAPRTRFDRDKVLDKARHHLIILAKNKTGYKNLVKLVSYAWTEGFYSKPRIDKDLLFEYHEGLIVSSACLGGQVPQLIMKGKLEEAKETILEYKEVFGDDYYLELMRHKTSKPEIDKDTFAKQTLVNTELIRFGKELGIKCIATNDAHFVNKEDSEAHDILICLNTGRDLDDPTRMRYSGEEYLKTSGEMAKLFADVPEALENTLEIAEKVEEYELNTAPIMPDFYLPDGFNNEDDYLKHLTYEGANVRYGEIDEDIKERLDFELDTIKKMGFPGYFLITWDFLKAAREIGVSVGPGRGSAAGSVVAYCLKITNIDPLKYNLLFERFLNPDRISMPDIDIDFDDDGRAKILDWVVEKYGKKRVAAIITFGTMAAKMAIRDVARVQKLPLHDADRVAKLVPERPGTTLAKAYKEVPEFLNERNNGSDLVKKTLAFAETLEGSVRHTGVHACGIIIGKDDLENYIPLSVAKDSNLYVTQYDGKHVESVGMLKMDFLGLKTLSIIKDAVENVKMSRGIDVDIDNVSLDDKETYELFARGETTAIFQFESDGMKKHLRGLKPNRFGDLIAMNALYRPGPMEYIPSFIDRKHGREKIAYDLPEMEEHLKETYGITVYQEQVMLLSQKLAGFTKGQADSLRKAMGKKIIAMMNELKGLFVKGASEKGHDLKTIEKIWKDWEAFAQYAFNKSHSTCYAYLSYQTAYLKAHYPAEFMAAVLSRNLSNIDKIGFFMDECKRMGLDILGPDVNESFARFNVNKQGALRFGMAAIKGVGEAAVDQIIEIRKKGEFKDIFDFVERVNLRTVNKRNLEGLAISGAFDGFGKLKRSQYFASANGGPLFIEELVKYGNRVQSDTSSPQQSLFGGDTTIEKKKPDIPVAEEWDRIDRLNKEKELIGVYLSAHPLDDYKLEIDTWCNAKLTQFADLKTLKGRDLKVAGIVTKVEHRTTKNGKPFGSITLEDYSDAHRLVLFGNQYLDFKKYFTEGYFLGMKGKVQHRFNKEENELEFNISQIEMLSEIKEKAFNSLAIKIPVENLTDDLIDEVHTLAEKHKGNAMLKFLIYEPASKVWVQMFSRTHRVQITNDLVEFLEKKPEIDFKIM